MKRRIFSLEQLTFSNVQERTYDAFSVLGTLKVTKFCKFKLAENLHARFIWGAKYEYEVNFCIFLKFKGVDWVPLH